MPRPAHRLRAAVLQESTPIAIYYGAQRGETLGAFEFAAAAFVERTCPLNNLAACYIMRHVGLWRDSPDV